MLRFPSTAGEITTARLNHDRKLYVQQRRNFVMPKVEQEPGQVTLEDFRKDIKVKGRQVSVNECVSESAREKVDHNNEIIRDECFSKWDNPLGFSQETMSMFLYLTAHLGALSIFNRDYSTPIPVGAVLFALLYAYLGGFGITIGCHRYWTHKTFKAKLPLQIILMTCQTIAGQYPIHKWCLDHRIHHKYTDTNADPYNSKRGFWFSHTGWIFLVKHKDLEHKLKTFDMSDLENDPVVRFQSRWYIPLLIAFSFVVPVSILHYVWSVSWFNSVILNFIRYVFILHTTSSVNSVAHMFGDKPYDKNISSTEVPWLAWIVAGESFHNFHHTFPSDYRTSEFGWKHNPSAMLIDMFAKIGWAYDLKTVSEEVVIERKKRTGFKVSDDVAGDSENSERIYN